MRNRDLTFAVKHCMVTLIKSNISQRLQHSMDMITCIDSNSAWVKMLRNFLYLVNIEPQRVRLIAIHTGYAPMRMGILIFQTSHNDHIDNCEKAIESFISSIVISWDLRRWGSLTVYITHNNLVCCLHYIYTVWARHPLFSTTTKKSWLMQITIKASY